MKKPMIDYSLFFDLCILCQLKLDTPSQSNICSSCLQDLPWLEHCCKVCALPLPSDQGNLICGQCQKKQPTFKKAQALFHYQFPINQLISGIKFNRNTQFISHIARLMADHLTTHQSIDCLMPIPMHRYSLIKRGFNQAALLCEKISQYSGIPSDHKSLIKARSTPQQHSLQRKERLKNQKGAFKCKPIIHKRILLIDDVMTTGATFEAASLALLNAGAEEVYGLALARTDK